MNKNKGKKPHDPIRAIVVKETAVACTCTEQYVRWIINPSNNNITTPRADEIRKTYRDRYAAYSSIKSI